IETMGERGRARQAETQRAEIIFEALAALRPFVNGQARRLVDHQHQAVAIDETSHYLFRSHGHLPRFGETAITNDDRERSERLWTINRQRSKAGGSGLAAVSSARRRRSAAPSPISSPNAGSIRRCSTTSRRGWSRPLSGPRARAGAARARG